MESPSSNTLGSFASACVGRTSHVHSISSVFEVASCAALTDRMEKPNSKMVAIPSAHAGQRFVCFMRISFVISLQARVQSSKLCRVEQWHVFTLFHAAQSRL